MIAWPEALIAEIAERRCIIFLGAGASRSSTSSQGDIRPPLWVEFVEHAIEKVAEDGVKKVAKRMVKQNRLLEAAEVITTSLPRPDFGLLVRSEFEAPRYQPSRLHECVRDLDVKVVVTSNYDDIYDRLCIQGEGGELYKVVRYHDSNLMELLRSTTRVIIKMHGSVTDTTKLVLSQSQYHEARRDYPHFFRELDALFTVSTVLFIGCSLEDLDLRLMLEGITLSAPSTYPHYAVLEAGRPVALVQALERQHNLKLLQYPRGKHEVITESLEELQAKVVEYRRTHP